MLLFFLGLLNTLQLFMVSFLVFVTQLTGFRQLRTIKYSD